MTETLDIKITKTSNSRLAQTDFENLPFGQIFSDHMFVADYADGEWKNLQIVPYGDILVSPAISSLLPKASPSQTPVVRRSSAGKFTYTWPPGEGADRIGPRVRRTAREVTGRSPGYHAHWARCRWSSYPGRRRGVGRR